MIKTESNKEYHSNSAVSKSKLIQMAKTPMYYKWYIENPQEPSADLIFGSAFHKLVLEPQDFDKEFAVMPDCDKRTKEGKQVYTDFMANVEANELQVITQEQYDTICKMCDTILKEKYAVALLNGTREQSMYWVDEFTEIECKCRPDCFKSVKDHIIITDLKSCRNADMRSIEKDVVQYGYDLQAHMYCKGVSENLNIPMENIDFMFIFVTKTEPYFVHIVQANDFVKQRGENLFREYLGTLKYCRETNNWYGYMGQDGLPNELSLPSYLLKE